MARNIQLKCVKYNTFCKYESAACVKSMLNRVVGLQNVMFARPGHIFADIRIFFATFALEKDKIVLRHDGYYCL